MYKLQFGKQVADFICWWGNKEILCIEGIQYDVPD